MPPASTLLLLACTANALHVLLLAPSPDQAAHSLRSLEYATTRLDVTIVAPRADVARVEAAAAASLGRAAVVAAENADVAALVAAHRARDADAAFAVVDGDAGGPVRRVAARAWAAALGELEGGACGVALPDAGDRFGSPARSLGGVAAGGAAAAAVAAGGATLETFAARLEAHCAGRPFHVAPDPDAAVAVRAGAGPAAPSRRRLADAHNKPTNPALVDTYYEDPLKDVRSTARASLALTLGFAGTGENVEAYNGADVSRAEAFCLLAATPHVAFVGDSVTRFHYFIFNEWLATGRVDTRLKKLEDSKWADGEGSAHYDEASRWYDPDWSESSTHRQHFIKTHPVPDDARALCGDDLVDDAITTQFWFMLDWKTIEPFARPLFEDTVAPWADLVLANVGWWELKDCPCGDAYGFGDPAGCQSNLAQTLDDYATLLLDRVPAAYLRTSPCCGEYTTETCVDDDEDRDSRRVEAVKGVDHYNFLAGKFVSKKSGPPLPLLDVHGFSNQWNVYARTQDGRHPVAPLYHIWTQLLLSALAVDGRIFPARADGTRRSDAYKAGATRAPAPRPTSAPPTSFAPTSAHCADGARNAGETDVDCGGTCAPCAVGATCDVAGDCATGTCAAGDGPGDLREAKRCAAAPTPRPTPRPTDGAAADGAAGGAAAKSKPAFVDDDGAGGVGYGGGASEILGGHGVREAFPGGCASDKAVDARAWRDALGGFRAGLGAAFSGGRGVCVLAPGARLIALLALAFVGAAARVVAVPRLAARRARAATGAPQTPEVELPEIRGKRQTAGAPRARAPEPGAAPATAAALELAAWVFVAAFCDAVAPTAVLPAGSRLLGENPDLWWFAMALLAVVCFAPPMVRTVGSDAADPALFFNRAQCNEWKGWMQVAFVAYHYANAQGVYVPIRWFVSAYVWLTGFGNARYFWKTSDFSGARFLKMVWRINCFAAPLSLATGTHWIAYYVVALHTVHFALCFAAFGLASACRRCLPGGAGRGRDLLGALPALVLYAAVAAAVWEFGGYDLALRPALSSAFGAPFETYFWYRTRMDYLSSFFGAVFAAALPSVVAVWVVGDRSKTAKGAAAAFAAALAAAGAVAWATHAKPAAYRDVQPYVGTLWVPLYALLRNATPASRNSVSMPLEWVGARSLELYLLQFHLLMNRSAGGVLWLLPDEDWPLCNLALAATLWLVAAHRVFVRTAELRDAAEARPAPTAALLAAAAAVYGAMRALACAGGAVALGAAAVAAFGGYVAADVLSRCEPPPPPAYAAVAVTEADDGDGEAPGSPGPPAREMV